MCAACGADLGGGNKATQVADCNDQTALVETDDLRIDHGFIGDHLLNIFPGHLFLGAFEGQDHIAILVFRVNHVHVNFLSHAQLGTFFLSELFQLASRNNAFGFGSNADKNLIWANARNHAFANFARLRQFNA